MLPLQIVVIFACMIFLIAVIRQIHSGRMLLQYSLIWICLAIISILGACFPKVIYALSDFCGFESPSNFILIAGLFFLMAICLSLSMIASKQSVIIKSLIQALAILENTNRNDRRNE